MTALRLQLPIERPLVYPISGERVLDLDAPVASTEPGCTQPR